MLATRHWDRLGNGGLTFTELGFGAAPMANLYRAISDDEAHAVLTAAWDAGLRYFDTAPLYGYGLSETRLNRFLRGKPRQDYVLSTKVGRLLEPDRAYALEKWGSPAALPFRPVFDFSYDGIMKSFEQSLQQECDAAFHGVLPAIGYMQ